MVLVHSATPPVVTIAKLKEEYYQVCLSSAQTDDPPNTNLDHARKEQACPCPLSGVVIEILKYQ